MKQIGKQEGWVWLVVGGAICLLSWRVDLGSFREPGAGFVSFFAGLSLVAIGVIMTLSKTFSTVSSNTDQAPRGRFFHRKRFRLAYTLAFIVAYGLVLDGLGYVVTTFLVMLGLFYDRGTNRLVPSALASLLTVISTYLIFQTWLHCQLPRGVFPWW